MDPPLLGKPTNEQARPIDRAVKLSDRIFDVNTLPTDMRRVYGQLAEKFGEEYGLAFIFTMRTAVELHRAWNMTILTSNTLQRIKDEYGLRMSWNLGVLRLKFRVEDGAYELHRKVPYDYDSENQDIYYRIAMALIARRITVHEALLYQSEAKAGGHTAGSGLFLRNFPGRLVLYPLQASMCAIIFFEGKWIDAAVAAICGLAAGLIEYALSCIGGQANVLLDVLVGLSTGLIGGLWYSLVTPCCLPAVFLGTLYWFFYGTAFVIGIFEIVAGELETGVTRFVAVSVKTFVLSLGASLGAMLAHGGGAWGIWFESVESCDGNFTTEKWWRIPIYLLCCVGVLGQYRLQINRYWAALIVQLVAYEAQYEVYQVIKESYTNDYLDSAMSNIVGGICAVLSAYAVAGITDKCQNIYSARILQHDQSANYKGSNCIYLFIRGWVNVFSFLMINRKSEVEKLKMEKTLNDQREELNNSVHPRDCIDLTLEDENLFIETLVGAQDDNIWSILMPAVYQLVPGSVIARFWFLAIFPPKTDSNESQESVFSNLMVISASLALGLIFGFTLMQICNYTFGLIYGCCSKENNENIMNRRRSVVMEGMYTVRPSSMDDPDSVRQRPEDDEEVGDKRE